MHLPLAALFFAGLPLLEAQTGSLSGVIYDQAGARLDHAVAVATNTATGLETSTQPKDKGEYLFEHLPAGNYSLRVSAAGLAAVQVNDVAVLENKTTTLNLTLSLADATPVTVVQVAQPPASVETPAAEDSKAILREIAAIRGRLALSADQQRKIRAIFEDRQAQVAAARQDETLLPRIRREKIQAIRQDADAKFRALLNENQLEEYLEILRERRQRALEKQRAGSPQ